MGFGPRAPQLARAQSPFITSGHTYGHHCLAVSWHTASHAKFVAWEAALRALESVRTHAYCTEYNRLAVYPLNHSGTQSWRAALAETLHKSGDSVIVG